MPKIAPDRITLTGLTDLAVAQSRALHGSNIRTVKSKNETVQILIDVFKEPMVIILLLIAIIYMSTGNYSDAIILGLAIVLISFISAYQNHKSNKAIGELSKLQQPHCKVIRNGFGVFISLEDVVVDDLIIIEEGTSIAADGIIVESNDLGINESILTGESLHIYKAKKELAFQGAMVTSGRGVVRVQSIGDETRFAQIGAVMEKTVESKSPLAIEIESAVKKMVFLGVIVFLLVWILSFQKNGSFIESLLFALTIAMSILPEEIPIAFSTFMALGSKRLLDEGVLVKNGKTLEALGNTTVICADKTGTITQNKMAIASCYDLNEAYDIEQDGSYPHLEELIWLSRLASEPTVFDPMEMAIEDLYKKNSSYNDYADLEFVHEYPLGGKPPMMTHIYMRKDGQTLVVCKGAPEGLITSSQLSEAQKSAVREQLDRYTEKGYRVLGVGQASYEGEQFPDDQHSFDFVIKGLIAFYDPPKEGVAEVFAQFNDAGVKTKIITGDNKETTQAIAKQIGFAGYDNGLTGRELVQLPAEDQASAINRTVLFSRMFPEAKLSAIEVMKAEGEVVTMIGDGVNDGPALKSAHIGVAMGHKGSEVTKQAADLVLVNDDLAAIIPAIKMGRRIHTNLKKAIGYIMAIHIPIVLMVFLPLLLDWRYAQLLTPVHVIILELIMGPTCSIVYENEPADSRIMQSAFWSKRRPLFNKKDILLTIFQGLSITLGLVVLYQIAIMMDLSESTTRTMIFSAMVSANLLLTLSSRSTIDSFVHSLKTNNNLILYMLIVTLGLLFIINTVPIVQNILAFSRLSIGQFILSILIGGLTIVWYEVVKYFRRINFTK